MQKIKLISQAVAAAFALALSSGAHAQINTPLALGSSVTTTDCPVLQSGITTSLSTKVAGAFVCRAADAVVGTINRVGLGTCHPGGSAKSRLVGCTFENNGATPPVITYTPTTCGVGNFDTDANGLPTTAKTGDAGKGLVSGLTLFSGTTTGGSVGEEGMASTACDAAGVKNLVGVAFP